MSTIGDVTTIPAGWYPDPADNSRSRWWDGAGWTSSISEPQPPAPAPQPFVEPQQYVAQPLPAASSTVSTAKALTRREIREQSQLALAASGSEPAGPDVIARSAHTAEAPATERKLPTIEEVIAMAAANPAPAPSVPFDWSPNAVVPTRSPEDVAEAAPVPAPAAAPVEQAPVDQASPAQSAPVHVAPVPEASAPAEEPVAAPVEEPVIRVSESNPLPGMPSYLNAGPPVLPTAAAAAPAPVAEPSAPAVATFVAAAAVAAAAPAPAPAPVVPVAPAAQAPAAPAPVVIPVPTGPAFPVAAAAPVAAPAPQQLTGTNPFEPTPLPTFGEAISPTATPGSLLEFGAAPLDEANTGYAVAFDERTFPANTFGVWAITVLPLFVTALAWLAFIQLGLDSSSTVRYVLIGAPVALATLFAALDKRGLENLGHTRTVPPVLAVLPFVYLIARLVRVGPKTLAPLLVWIVTAGASGAYVYLELATFMAALGL